MAGGDIGSIQGESLVVGRSMVSGKGLRLRPGAREVLSASRIFYRPRYDWRREPLKRPGCMGAWGATPPDMAGVLSAESEGESS
jgi:hypothetical protein